MTNQMQELFDDIDKSLEGKQEISADYVEAMGQTLAAVQSWCDELHLGHMADSHGVETYLANEEYKVEDLKTCVGAEKIAELVDKCNVAECHKRTAMKRVAALLCACLGTKGKSAFLHNRTTDMGDHTKVALETLFPAGVLQGLNTGNVDGSVEAFGMNIDRVQPDLKTILSVGLLQFHANLTPRIVPIKTVSQGNVTIVRESMEVYDMSKNARLPIRLIELYKDPRTVNVRATRIVPLAANDTAGNFLVADGIYKFQKPINMLELALDSSKVGYEKYNHTDLVEEGIVCDGILVKLTATKTLGTSATGDYYVMFHIPTGRGRLTQISDDLRSSDRRLNLDRFAAVANADTAKFTEVASLVSTDGVLAGLKDGLSLRVDFNVSIHVDRKIGALDAKGFLSLRLNHADGSADTTAQAEWLAGTTATLVGFTLDARHNEDNKRKTSIRAEINRRSMSYELPVGRNFVVDTAIGQDGSQNAAARLAQLEHIGRDCNNLDIIGEVMRAVHDQNVDFNNDKESQMQLAATYAAGDQVNPYVYMSTMDMSGLYGIRSGDMSGDIKQYVKQYFNRVTSGILAKSLYQQQLSQGAKVAFRLITGPEILGNLFMMKHFHEHLDTDENGTGGVEHVMVLDNGVRLEIVTSNFTDLESKIILIPFLTSSQDSILNFGTDYDQGTLVGSFQIGTDGGASFHRMFSVTRELLIPTNVIGAIINVSGTSNVNVTSAGQFTVSGTEENA